MEHPLLLVLDGVTDPHNLGACLRVANGAGADAVLAPKDRAAGITPAVSKVASGAAESTPYLMVTNLARTLAEMKERNIWIVGADERAEKTLYEADLPESIAWVLGAEGEGMRRLTRESLRPPRAHPDARRGREPQRVGVGGGMPVRISASSSRSGVISRSLPRHDQHAFDPRREVGDRGALVAEGDFARAAAEYAAFELGLRRSGGTGRCGN